MRFRFVLAALVLSAGLTACGGDTADSGAVTLPPVTASATPTATSGAMATNRTGSGTSASAEEFVRHFYRELAAAYVHKAPERIEALSAPNCEVCRRYIESITQIRDQDAQVEPYVIEVVDVVAPGVDDSASSLSVSALVNVSEFVARDANGEVLLREPAQDRSVRDVQLVRSGSSWLVQGVRRS